MNLSFPTKPHAPSRGILEWIALIGSLVLLLVTVSAGVLRAQSAAVDPSARLRAVLPADVAERVLARIAEARARELPARALEKRALKFASRGVTPPEIEQAINAQFARMESARTALREGRSSVPAAEEIEAGAEALRQGVDGEAVSTLAKAAPSGRTLAVPLFVLGTLVDRGLPSDEALARVRARLEAKASDEEIERIPGEQGIGRGGVRGGPDGVRRGPPEGTGRPATVPPGGRPATPPGRPTTPGRP